MSRIVLLTLSLLMLTNCGIKRPLIAPKDIPAYEAAQQRRIDRIANDKVPAAPDAAAPAPVQGQ